jgi:hypothetical protein
MAFPVVNMNKGEFPDKGPFVTIRTPCSNAYHDGALIIIGYTWINLEDGSSGYVAGNASHVFADGNPVVLLKDQVPTHIGGSGTVFGE